MTYSVPLKVTFRLFVYDKDPDTGVKHMRDAKEEEVFFGDIPLMTDNGTFIINGTERVIVVAAPPFARRLLHEGMPPTPSSRKIIPYRGSWVEFEYDQKNILYVRIDRKRKFLGSVFLRALGLTTDEEILRQFYTPIRARITEGGSRALLRPPRPRPGRGEGASLHPRPPRRPHRRSPASSSTRRWPTR